LTADVNLAAEDEVEVGCGLIFGEEEVAVGCDALGTVGSDPAVFVFGKSLELDDGAECGDDLG
jgi:hypothetical protein